MTMEFEILKFISERHVVPKKELMEKFSEIDKNLIKSIISSLESKKLISIINPIGSDTIVITRRGLQEVEKS